MRFVNENTPKGLLIPKPAMAVSGFNDREKVEYHALDNTVVVLKRRMTAMELIHAARQLQELSVELHTHLAKVCGFCDNCEGGCPFDDLGEADIELPDSLRREAGIPMGAKLCACVDEEEGTVTIAQADYAHDLRDVPPKVLAMLAAADVCLGELEEHLMVGDIVYGR